MIAAEVTSTLDPVAPAKKRHTSIAAIFLARAVPSVKSVKIAKETRKTGRRPYISDSGAYEKSVSGVEERTSELTQHSGPNAKPS